MNYTAAHEFRSSAVVEFGKPVKIPTDLVEMYRGGARKEATQQLLRLIWNAMLDVTITSPEEDNIVVSRR
jgi:glycerol-3-phosphate O-acyltransferase/dihydroxyacetone phosphate acyltransferase